MADQDEDEGKVPSYMVWAQIGLVAIGLAGVIFHAFPIREGRFVSHDWPILDPVDVLWVAVVIVAILLPNISEVSFGEASLKLRRLRTATREARGDFEDTIDDFANLVQNWSTSVMLYISLLAAATDDARRELLLHNYMRDRMGEASEFLSDEPNDKVRIMLWIFDPDTQKLEYFFGNDDPPLQKEYAPGEGMIGQAFLEKRRYNEADVRNCPGYKKTRQGDPPYRAVMCTPVYVGDDAIGMLTADKKEAEIFSDDADEILRGLASQCAIAIDQFRKAG
jgi:GAF domain-containing protein